MLPYLYNTPQILTDSIFVLYGGQTGTSSPMQREIAYTLAEEQMVEHIGAYLVPTTITGTHFWRGKGPVELDYGWIRQVHRVTISSVDWADCCNIVDVTGCYAVRNSQYGYLDVAYILNCAGCTQIIGLPPYQIEVVYETGFATGTYTAKSMLQALTLAAQINLNEIDISLSNESTADVGVEFFINQGYHERRRKVPNTVFGNSPIAGRIARMVNKFRARPAIGFR